LPEFCVIVSAVLANVSNASRAAVAGAPEIPPIARVGVTRTVGAFIFEFFQCDEVPVFSVR
jgi:hypothetical protein